jgi:hypothetical protein
MDGDGRRGGDDGDELSRLYGVQSDTERAYGKDIGVRVAMHQHERFVGLAGPTKKALQMEGPDGRTRWSGQHQSLGRTITGCGRLGVKSISGAAGVRSLSTLTLSLHRCLVSYGRNLSLQSGERLADLERDFDHRRSNMEAARKDPVPQRLVWGL